MRIERDSLATISFFFVSKHNNDYQNINEYVNGVFDWIWFYKTERISLSERQHNINENIC